MSRPKPTLETLRAAHGRAVSAKARKDVRLQARKLAAELGVPIPEWCTIRPRRAKRETLVVPRRERAVAAITRIPEIPVSLSEWRRRGEGRVVQIDFRGRVALHDLATGSTLKFKSVNDAVAAVA